jgi:hypothetical protein
MAYDNGQGALNTLKPQPGQRAYSDRKFHPLPGVWAREQMNTSQESSYQNPTKSASRSSTESTELQRALKSEAAQHAYWEKWQGVRPGLPEYEDPRAWQNTLLPNAKYGTEGRGYG